MVQPLESGQRPEMWGNVSVVGRRNRWLDFRTLILGDGCFVYDDDETGCIHIGTCNGHLHLERSQCTATPVNM